jgi:hypothetical protein
LDNLSRKYRRFPKIATPKGVAYRRVPNLRSPLCGDLKFGNLQYSHINNINNNVRNLHTVDTTGASWALTPGNSYNNNVSEALKYKKLTVGFKKLQRRKALLNFGNLRYGMRVALAEIKIDRQKGDRP